MTMTPHVVRAAFIAMLLTTFAGCATSEHFVRGTVVGADSASVTVRHKSGQVVRSSVSPSTTYRWDHQTASAQDLVAGARVMVILEQARGPFSTKEVRTFSKPKTAAQPRR
jgi:hypothetical protein